MKAKKIIIIIAVIALITALILYFRKRSKDKAAAVQEPEPNSPGTIVRPLVPLYPFQQGSQGEIIKKIQKALNLSFEAGLVVDGIYGPKTEAALVRYSPKWQIFTEADALQALEIIGKKVNTNKGRI